MFLCSTHKQGGQHIFENDTLISYSWKACKKLALSWLEPSMLIVCSTSGVQSQSFSNQYYKIRHYRLLIQKSNPLEVPTHHVSLSLYITHNHEWHGMWGEMKQFLGKFLLHWFGSSLLNDFKTVKGTEYLQGYLNFGLK